MNSRSGFFDPQAGWDLDIQWNANEETREKKLEVALREIADIYFLPDGSPIAVMLLKAKQIAREALNGK